MLRTLIVVVFCAAAATAGIAAPVSVDSSPKNLLAKVPETRSIFCDSCLTIMDAIDVVALEDTAAVKQVCDAVCDQVWSGFPLTNVAGCKNWLNTDVHIIQLKIKNGWSPMAICKDYKMCA